MNAFVRWTSSGAMLCALLAFGHARAHIWIDKGIAETSPTDANAQEGTAVAMFGDVLVVGAPNLDKPAGQVGIPPAVLNAGGVRIYRRNAGAWVLSQTLYSPDPISGARFGAAVDVEDNVLVVGEPRYTRQSFINNGRALVYVRANSGDAFQYRKEIYQFGLTDPSCGNSCNYPEFGASVDIAAGPSGRFAVAVGAPGDDVVDVNPEATGTQQGIFIDEGSTFVVRFRTLPDGSIADQNDAENSWYIRAPIAFNNNDGQQCLLFTSSSPCVLARLSYRFSGSSVALARTDCSDCDDVFYLVVGAPNATVIYENGDDADDRFGGGAAWIYRIDSDFAHASNQNDVVQQWRAIDPLEQFPLTTAPFLVPHFSTENLTYDDEHFGSSVDVRLVDGHAEIVVGASRAVLGQTNPGAVYYFTGISGYWHLTQTIRATFPGEGDGFGSSLAFTSDRLTVGAPSRKHTVNGQTIELGSVFELTSTGAPLNPWQVIDELFESPYTVGKSLASSAEWIATGVPNNNATQTWQRGWMLDVTEPTHGVVQILPPFFPISQALNCPPDCSIPLENGRHLQPAALADDGYSFFNWQGAGCDDVETNSCPIVMDSDKLLTANFIINVGNTRTLNVSIAEGSGTVSVDAGEGNDLSCPGTCDGVYANGTSMYIQAVPADGFEFAGWGGACGSSNPCSFLLNTNVNLTATFRPVAGNHMVTVDFLDSGTGRVTLFSDEPPYVCDNLMSLCSISRANNSTISAHACTSAGSTFTGWAGFSGGSTCWGTAPCEFILESDTNIAARFVPSDELFKNGFEDTVCGIGEF